MNNIKYTKKSLIIVLAIFTILLLTGGTYAYWMWSSNINKNVIFNTISGIEDYIVYDEGESYFVGNFQPTNTFCQNVNNTISFKKTSEVSESTFSATIYMDINSIGENISNSSDVYWIVTEGDNTINCENGLYSEIVLASGTFKNKKAGDTIKLLNKIEVLETEKQYTVWMWIDSNGTDLSKLSGETIDTNIWTEFMMVDSLESADEGLYTESILNGTDPELEPGMIPVTISDTGAVTVANIYQEWYKYEDKEWANAVLVNSTKRSTYINQDGSFNESTPIPEDDILAYYVWIPRYKYTFPKADGNPETISIIFENNKTSKSIPASGKASGTDYYTHPAFTFGTKELNGIWVGKFETTGDATTPTIKPNMSSLTNQNVSTQFITSLKFAGGSMNTSTGAVTFIGNNTYGLTNATDSHMMKNREWGAVSYLSHSIYGINEEIRINNYWSSNETTLTGCGAVTSDETFSSNCGIPYNTPSTEEHTYPQSTTGNITGIFDMSGGTWEHVMGVLSNLEGKPRSGYSGLENSGFNGLVYNGSEEVYYTLGTLFPECKYYDSYLQLEFDSDNLANVGLCKIENCGGHALNETTEWYDRTLFVTPEYPWFLRSGHASDGALSGAFRSSNSKGWAIVVYSWRSVLVTN